jgi:hypothetical protein
METEISQDPWPCPVFAFLHPLCLRFIWILICHLHLDICHLHLDISSCIITSYFSTKIYMHFSSYRDCYVSHPSHPPSFDYLISFYVTNYEASRHTIFPSSLLLHFIMTETRNEVATCTAVAAIGHVLQEHTEKWGVLREVRDAEMEGGRAILWLHDKCIILEKKQWKDSP